MPTEKPTPKPADTATATAVVVENCKNCEKPAALCVCDRITGKLANRTEVLVLQHPQEPDKILGSARLTELSLKRVDIKVGLSWASLSHALDRDADNSDWGVLYLGSLPAELTESQLAKPLLVLDRAGKERLLKPSPLKGIVVLDGTWSQAKTLWWRNAWLLKLQRVLIHPKEPSAYGRLRKEPRRECLSTIEAVAETLDALGENPEIRKTLRALFRTLLQRTRDANKVGEAAAQMAAAESAAKHPPKRGGRGSKPRGRSPASRGGGPMD